MRLIENWLKGSRNYYVGIALYKSLPGANQQLIQLLSKGKTPFAEAELVKAFKAMLSKPVVKKQPQPDPELDKMPPSADAVMESIRNEWMPLYMRMNTLRHMLWTIEGNTPEKIAQRQPIAFEVLELEQQCIQLWAKRNHYLQHGRLPEAKEVKVQIPKDPIELATLIENIKRNIRRNKAFATKNPTKAIYVQRYNDYKASYYSVTGKEYVESEQEN